MGKRKKRIKQIKKKYLVLNILIQSKIETSQEFSDYYLNVLSDIGIATTEPKYVPLIVKYKKIEAIYEDGTKTYIYLNNEVYVVQETMSEIMDAIFTHGTIRENRRKETDIKGDKTGTNNKFGNLPRSFIESSS